MTRWKKARWIVEQRERLEQQLADIQRYSFDPQSIEVLRERLEARLATETPDDRRFILEALGTKVMVQADGTWELELQVPREVPALEGGLHIVNARPEWNYTVHHICATLSQLQTWSAWSCWPPNL